jgi:hypothetical protein
METWEKLIIGVFALLILFWFFPGIRPMLEKSKDAPKDWAGVLIPVGLVVLFIIFLISTL